MTPLPPDVIAMELLAGYQIEARTYVESGVYPTRVRVKLKRPRSRRFRRRKPTHSQRAAALRNLLKAMRARAKRLATPAQRAAITRNLAKARAARKRATRALRKMSRAKRRRVRLYFYRRGKSVRRHAPQLHILLNSESRVLLQIARRKLFEELKASKARIYTGPYERGRTGVHRSSTGRIRRGYRGWVLHVRCGFPGANAGSIARRGVAFRKRATAL